MKMQSMDYGAALPSSSGENQGMKTKKFMASHMLKKPLISLLARGAALYILTSLFTAPFTQQALGVDTSPLALTGPDEAWIPIVAGLSRWTGSSFVPSKSLDFTAHVLRLMAIDPVCSAL